MTYYGEAIPDLSDCYESVTDSKGIDHEIYTDGIDYYVNGYDINEGAENDLTKVNEFNGNPAPNSIDQAVKQAKELVG